MEKEYFLENTNIIVKFDNDKIVVQPFCGFCDKELQYYKAGFFKCDSCHHNTFLPHDKWNGVLKFYKDIEIYEKSIKTEKRIC